MNTNLLVISLIVCVFATLSSAWPMYEEHELQPYNNYYEEEPLEYVLVRQRRSPQQQNPPQPNRGSVTVTGGHTTGQGGFVRGDYNHKIWEGRSGARVDANTYYQRNWGQPGPRQDYGAGVRLTVPLGGRRN